MAEGDTATGRSSSGLRKLTKVAYNAPRLRRSLLHESVYSAA